MRARPLTLVLTLSASALLAACGGGEVVVKATSSTETGEAAPVEDMVVTYLPYDRDSIFDALDQQAETQRPGIPQSLRDQFDQVIEAQREWRSAEDAWSQVRDSLETLSQQMEGLDRTSTEYMRLFDQFEALEGRVGAVERRKDRLFQRFDSLQRGVVERSDSVRAEIRNWEEEAYHGYVDLTDSILRAEGAEIRRDTTDAQGVASASLPSGDWWVYARTSPGPYEELYWNIHVLPGQVDTLRLSRDNAEVRPSL